jgi:hypothetical protein
MSGERTTKDSLAVGFTGGPWSFDSAGRQAPILKISCADGDHPAHELRGYEEKVANARLMASAPELLAALERMLGKAYKQNWNDMYPDELAQAEAAVDKARGQ